MRAAAGLIIALSVLAGAALAADKTPEEMAREIRARPVPESVFQKNADGSMLHLQSGLECPPAAEDFRLFERLAIDGFGFDVDCNYESAAGAFITMYLTERGGRPVQQDFDGAVAAIKQRWPQVTAYDNPPAPSPRTWLSALYTKDDTNQRTGVWVADFAGWTLKFRATYRAGGDDAVFAALRALAAAAERTALAHLEACAKSPPPQRSATVIDDKEKLMMLSIVSLLPGAAAEGPAGAATAAAPNWCVETRIVKDNVPLLFWRNIAPGALTVDRITPMTVDKPPVFESVINPLATLISGEMANKPGETPLVKGVLHQMMFTNERGGHVFAFYDGRPDGETLAQLTANIIHDKARPVAGYDPKTRQMNIYVGN